MAGDLPTRIELHLEKNQSTFAGGGSSSAIGEADPMAHEPSRLVSHAQQPVKLVGVNGFLGRTKET